ncbi:MAG: rRNA synthase [Petroclostridium sp.]|jgi:23S rRNA pseudouridine2605 synthase|uniref:pseudouridine synthase n=1 Tax=Petroclostridium xylanilyticum TaxID=1792311 RepID=UPI001FA8FB0E|nr:pseudouridine synthase [Petroclostridium xylanilyticum]MBZ4646830.1 rluB2 [Clostridia bacterium]MDK2811556.1 rRNA synthase [Petroclostridium sp.]
MEEDNVMRLQKFIALSGFASRRKAEEIILEGRVKVNNQIIQTLGEKINIKTDIVEIDGKRIEISANHIYIMLNKPVGYVTTVSDQFNRPTVMDLIKNDIKMRLYPVGRLDYDTEGLLLLTNDGELTYKLTHPKHNIEKVYIATVKGIPAKDELQRFREGLYIDDYLTAPAKIEIIKIMKGSCELKIVIHEGKNRQVRKMCEKIGHPVIKLKRIAIGNLHLGNLPLGKWRHLKDVEVNFLKKI